MNNQHYQELLNQNIIPGTIINKITKKTFTSPQKMFYLTKLLMQGFLFRKTFQVSTQVFTNETLLAPKS